MKPYFRRIAEITVTIGVLATFALSAAPAVALTDEGSALQQRVDDILDRFPGGTQISFNEVSWEGGAVVLTLMSLTGVSLLRGRVLRDWRILRLFRHRARGG